MKKNFNLLISAIVFAIAIFVFIYFVKTRETSGSPRTEKASLLVNKEIPKIAMLESQTGKDLSSDVNNGEVLIVYMLKGCEACHTEIQTISQIKSQTNVRIFGVMFEDKDVVDDYINKEHIEFPVLIDNERKLFKSLDLQYFPTNLKLKNGVIQKALFGSPIGENKLLEFIQNN